jgi:hypothetical protein
MYYSGKNYFIKKESLISPTKKNFKKVHINFLEKIVSKIKYGDVGNKNGKMPSYSLLELKLENIVKY